MAPLFNSSRYVYDAISRAATTLGAHRPIPLRFPQIYESDWFRQKEALKVNELQYRKEISSPFYHEFVVVRLSDDSIFRFDRRPESDILIDTLSRFGSEAIDTVQEVKTMEALDNNSRCLAALHVGDQLCVKAILAICFGIRDDSKTRRYTLQKYNCYFFSWSIVSIVARYLVASEDLAMSTIFLESSKVTVSKCLASDLLDNLLATLPATLTAALSTVLVQALASILSQSLPRGSSQEVNKFQTALTDALNLRLYAPLSGSKLFWGLKHRIISVIQKVLKSSELKDDIRNKIYESMDYTNYRLHPSTCQFIRSALQPALWQDEVGIAIIHGSEAFTQRWLTPEDSRDQIPAALWTISAAAIISQISTEPRVAVSGSLVEKAQQCLIDIDPLSYPKCCHNQEARVLSTMRSRIEGIVPDAILEATREEVWVSVGMARNDMIIIRRAGAMSLAKGMSSAFPDILPLSLHGIYPSTSIVNTFYQRFNSKNFLTLQQELGNSRSRDRISHKELQRYISNRIDGHSWRLTLAGHGLPSNSRHEIRDAISRVWITAANVLAEKQLEKRSKIDEVTRCHCGAAKRFKALEKIL
ncbi:hypothetical protein BDV93DRAFT_611511 [Ceratobasidium sp. AG-I]|nr:hypothetical protein BDV93DRAFT_611511 [Ceratobasidium sp. AG-I]